MSEKDITRLVKRYEEALLSGKSIYFDADEFDLLADFFDSTEDIDTAKEVIATALLIHPESHSLLVKKMKFLVYDGEYTKALHLFDAKLDTEYDFDLYLLRIDCLLQLERYTEAHVLTEEIVENEEYSELDTALSELGFLYVEADLFDEAILYFTKSLEYNPDNIDVLSDLAYAYEMIGDFDAAIDTSNKILDIDAYTYDAWVNIGKLYSIRDNYEKAVDAFDFALTINESDRTILKLKAHCLSLCGRIEEAIGIFENILEQTPDDTSLYFLLAECVLSLERYDEAIAYIDRYETIEEVNIQSITKKSYVYLQKGDSERAWAILEKALLEDSLSEIVNMMAGEIKFKQGLYAEAEEFYLKAYAESPDNFALADRLVTIQIMKEDYLKAIEYSKELLELEPYNEPVKQRLALIYFELDDKGEFGKLLTEFSEQELQSLLSLIYPKEVIVDLDREQLIRYLTEARACRILFKNIRY